MKLLAVVTVAVALLFAGQASAHNSAWYWSQGLAQKRIVDEGLQWSDGFDEVLTARCYPWGAWIPDRGKKFERLWKHFRCRVQPFYGGDPFWISLHVTGKYTWNFAFLRWA